MPKRTADKTVRDWREFELFVARLEAVMRTPESVFCSPDHLLDSETLEHREVDCSITLRTESGEDRISIECRRRETKEDVMWIEQLATKRRALNLSQTIAVSAKGFSKAAYAKAKHHGISLNTYKESALGVAARPLAINHVRTTGEAVDVSYKIGDDSEHPTKAMRAQLDKLMSRAEPSTVILREIDGGETMTFEQLLKSTLDHPPKPQTGSVKRKFKITFPRATTFVGFPDSVILDSLSFALNLTVAQSAVENAVFGVYSCSDATLLEVVKTDVVLNGAAYKFEVLYQLFDEAESLP